MNNNVIDHPDYYRLPCGRDLEDFIHFCHLSFAQGSAVKYLWRAGKKDGESKTKDLNKCLHYLTYISKHDPYGRCFAADEAVADAKKWDGKEDRVVPEYIYTPKLEEEED